MVDNALSCVCTFSEKIVHFVVVPVVVLVVIPFIVVAMLFLLLYYCCCCVILLLCYCCCCCCCYVAVAVRNWLKIVLNKTFNVAVILHISFYDVKIT